MEAVTQADFSTLPFGMDAPYFQAGLAGYSDTAMRLIARRHGCPYCITEAMLDRLLIDGGKGLKIADLDDQDHPIAGQIMGCQPGPMAEAAGILVKMGYDTIDVNLACPVRKIRRKHRGGHLLQAPDEAIAILEAVRQAVPDHVPPSVKLRRATNASAEAKTNFFAIFEAVIELGYTVATVHGRTVEQKYLGPSKWEFLADLTRRYPSSQRPGFFIFGSGDIWQATDIVDMLERTGVDAVSVARGCIGNPWIFRQARALMRGDRKGAATAPTIGQQRQVLLDHFKLSVDLHGEDRAGRMMRKFGIKFSHHHPQGAAVKDGFIRVKTLSDWNAVLDRFYRDEPAAVAAAQTV